MQSARRADVCKKLIPRLALLGALLIAAGCSRIVVPNGEKSERLKSSALEEPYSIPINKRALPDLETTSTLQTVLVYAFNSNGEIEAAYREWRAAIEKIPQAGALADPRIDFSILFNPANFQSFATYLSEIMNSFRVMASQEIPGKGKRLARAEVALAEAQAAGERFRAAKYKIQNKVTQAYARLALNEALASQATKNLQLLRDAQDIMFLHLHDISAGAGGEVTKSQLEIEKAESDLKSIYIMHDSLVAELNGSLGRSPANAFASIELPEIELPKKSDADLFLLAIQNNPDLASLRKEVEAKGAQQALAELERKPDFMISGGLDDPITPIFTASMTLPINHQRLRAMIAEALAMRQAAEARLRSEASNAEARVAMALAGMRDSQRILDDYKNRIVPRTKELLDLQQRYYGSGTGTFMDVLDTQRLLIDYKKLTLQAEADRLRYYSELEEIIGQDLFNFAPNSGSASTTESKVEGGKS